MEHLSARRRSISALAAVIVMGSFVTAQHAPEGPVNVLFIMSDQHNAHTLGSYGNGFGGVQQPLTPNLDQLASEGVRFTNAFCSTGQCCPSRFTVLTGQWPHNHGNRWNDIWEPLTGMATFPSLARDAGYVTGSFGKHHMYWLEQSPPLLADHGFDEIVDLDDYRDFCLANGQPIWTSPGNHWTMPNMPMSLARTGYTFNTNEFHPAGYVTDRVVQFLEERAPDGGDGQPFICWYLLHGPHPPLLPSGPADIHDWAHLYHPFETLDLPPNFD